MMPLGDFSAVPCGLAHSSEVGRARLASVSHVDVYVYRTHLWAKVQRRDGNLTGAFEAVDLAVGWTADGMLRFGTFEVFFRTFGLVDDAGFLVGWQYNAAMADNRKYETERKAEWRRRQAEGMRRRRTKRRRKGKKKKDDLKSVGRGGGGDGGGGQGRHGHVPGTERGEKRKKRGSS
jgi:hypothetical protein